MNSGSKEINQNWLSADNAFKNTSYHIVYRKRK